VHRVLPDHRLHCWQFVSFRASFCVVVTETPRVRFSKQCTSGLKVRTSGESALGIDSFELRFWRCYKVCLLYLPEADNPPKAIKPAPTSHSDPTTSQPHLHSLLLSPPLLSLPAIMDQTFTLLRPLEPQHPAPHPPHPPQRHPSPAPARQPQTQRPDPEDARAGQHHLEEGRE